MKVFILLAVLCSREQQNPDSLELNCVTKVVGTYPDKKTCDDKAKSLGLNEKCISRKVNLLEKK